MNVKQIAMILIALTTISTLALALATDGGDTDYGISNSHGASITYRQHFDSCKEHRNFNAFTRKWEIIPRLEIQKCNEIWSKYIAAKQARGIVYNSPKAISYSQERIP